MYLLKPFLHPADRYSLRSVNWRFASLISSFLMLGAIAVPAAGEPSSEGPTAVAVPTRKIASGLSPQEAADYMSTPSGFHVTLAAGEPDVHQPIAMAFDDRGRLWIAEAYTYPVRAPEGQGRDKIVILEDNDLDGKFETRKVFASGLNLVSGLEVGFGGVWVGAAPYLMFIPDRDRDDRPDSEPVVLLDGFGYQDTHETLNAFNWGPDGWLYGCHGVFTHSRVGKPGTPEEERIPMNAAVWRYHPVRHEFDVFARGTSNPWGVDFNDHGHTFITACVIPHLWHVIQGARYHRQGGRHFNPHIYDDIKTIARHRHYAGDIRDHAWWGKEPETPADTLAAGGGHAHCGAMIYLGDNWPAEYRDQIFMNNVHGNRVNNDRLFRHGSGYAGDRAPDILLANDKWFRGINLRYGPDGSVYLIDWYDPNACHRTNPEIWDRTNGRVYNLAYGTPERKRVDLSRLSDEQLVGLQRKQNDWYVRMARRLLQERAAAGTLDVPRVSSQLWQMATSQQQVPRRLRAIWALHGIGQLDSNRLASLRNDADENVRGWAIQLELEDHEIADDHVAQLERMAAGDDSALVRLYLASALQRLPNGDRWTIARHLLARAEDADDHNLPLMIWYGIEPLVTADVERALQLADDSQISQVREFIVRRAATDESALEPLVRWMLNKPSDQQRMVLDQMLQAFEGRVGMSMPKSWDRAYERLSASSDVALRQRADQLAILFGDRRVLPRMRQLVADESAAIDRRKEALDILVRAQDKQAARALQAALAEPRLRGDALRGLGTLNDPRTPETVIRWYEELTDDQRRDAIGTLTTRVSYANVLLDAIQQELIPAKDLHAYNVRQLLSLGDSRLKQRLQEIWGKIGESSADKRQRIAELTELCRSDTMQDAHAGRGRRLFQTHCANCHRLFGRGGEVGPDITGSNRGELDYILQNMVDPSAVVGKDYQMTVFELSDGRVVSGLIQKETDSAVTVRTLNDTVLLAKSEIDYRELSPLSMMPEGLLDRLTSQQICDLVAYLQSPRQVPIAGPPAPIDEKTGRVPGATEGESMKVVGKSNGTVQSQSMQSFEGDRWSGHDQLWWTGAGPGDYLSVELRAPETATYRLDVVLTRAPDYATVQLMLDNEPLGEPIDLYAPHVVTTGVLSYSGTQLDAGVHRLGIKILGANPKARKSFMVGLDWVKLSR